MKYWLFVFVLLASCSFGPAPSADVSDGSVSVLSSSLEVPWDVAVLGSGQYLVTERPGRLLLVNGSVSAVSEIEVFDRGEAGLLGIALHPDFVSNRFVYLYLTFDDGDGTRNRVVRYVYDDSFVFDRVIVDDIPGAAYHDGGALEFGPDGYLYVGTGDAGDSSLAQDVTSLAGKVLRVTDDGDVVSGNMFGNEVYSYGHRNVQGLAFDADGNLWSTEHGRSGVRSGYDEVNLIEAGGNYGWPLIEGDEEAEGMISPVIHSGADTTWAPASAAVLDDTLYFGGLRGGAVYSYEFGTETVERVVEGYGRIRAVLVDGDDLLFTTSNRDGRGESVEEDDRLLVVRIKNT